MYIRQTVNKPLPAGIIPFYTSLDVALAEVKAGRLSESQAIRVGKTILAEEDTSLILPGFASCPKASTALVNTSELEQVTTEVSLKIQKICNDRNVTVDLIENNVESDSDISEIISPVME